MRHHRLHGIAAGIWRKGTRHEGANGVRQMTILTTFKHDDYPDAVFIDVGDSTSGHYLAFFEVEYLDYSSYSLPITVGEACSVWGAYEALERKVH